MEMQEVKNWLNRGRAIKKELDALEQSKINLYLRAVSMTQRYEGDAVAGSKDNHAKMDRYAEYADLVDRKAAELGEVSGEIFRVVTRMRDGTERAVLIHRYLNLLDWETLARAMDYSRRQVIRIHGAALLSVKEILEEKHETDTDNREKAET